MLQSKTIPHPNGVEGAEMIFHGNAEDPLEYDEVPDDIARAFIEEGCAEDCAGLVLKTPDPEPEPDPEPDPEPEALPDLEPNDNDLEEEIA